MLAFMSNLMVRYLELKYLPHLEVNDGQFKANKRPYWRYSRSLHTHKDWWDKCNVTWFLRGQTSDKICQYKKSPFFFNFRTKIMLLSFISKVEKWTPGAQTLLFTQVIGLFKGIRKSLSLHKPIQSTSVFLWLIFNPDEIAKVSSK